MADAVPSRPNKAKKVEAEDYDLNPGEKFKEVDGRKCVEKKGANGNTIRYFIDGKKA